MKNQQTSGEIEWMDEFDRRFGVNSIYPVEVKDFIKKLLSRSQEEMIERIEGKVEKMNKKQEVFSNDDNENRVLKLGPIWYNEAISNVISLLEEESKK